MLIQSLQDVATAVGPREQTQSTPTRDYRIAWTQYQITQTIVAQQGPSFFVSSFRYVLRLFLLMEYVSSSLCLLSTMLSSVHMSTRRDRSSGLLIVHVSVVSMHIVSNNAIPSPRAFFSFSR